MDSPRERIGAECGRRGRAALIAGCAELLSGRFQDVDDALIVALGGENAAAYVLSGGEGGKGGYWPRVWAARGLLHAWDDAAAAVATAALIGGCADQSWRVREMAAKVIARHRVGDALAAVAELRDDPVPRVRAAAGRAVVFVTASGA